MGGGGHAFAKQIVKLFLTDSGKIEAILDHIVVSIFEVDGELLGPIFLDLSLFLQGSFLLPIEVNLVPLLGRPVGWSHRHMLRGVFHRLFVVELEQFLIRTISQLLEVIVPLGYWVLGQLWLWVNITSM